MFNFIAFVDNLLRIIQLFEYYYIYLGHYTKIAITSA